MNLLKLRTFLSIIEMGNLVRACEQLNVSQSTVTARLNSLENELRQVLINRQKSGATLTAVGVCLQRYANTISDLWPAIDSKMFDYIQTSYPSFALSVWHGNQNDLTNWLNAGLTDISLSYWTNAKQNQTVFPLNADELILVSTRKDSPIKFDPDYIFVEAGDDFGKRHTSTYADANTARISFGTAQLGLEYLMQKGGSAYLPMRIAKPLTKSGKLHRLKDAPTFDRSAFLIVNKTVLDKWVWFDDCMEAIIK